MKNIEKKFEKYYPKKKNILKTYRDFEKKYKFEEMTENLEKELMSYSDIKSHLLTFLKYNYYVKNYKPKNFYDFFVKKIKNYLNEIKSKEFFNYTFKTQHHICCSMKTIVNYLYSTIESINVKLQLETVKKSLVSFSKVNSPKKNNEKDSNKRKTKWVEDNKYLTIEEINNFQIELNDFLKLNIIENPSISEMRIFRGIFLTYLNIHLHMQRPQVFINCPRESIKFLKDTTDGKIQYYFLYLGTEKVLRFIKNCIFPIDQSLNNIVNYYMNIVIPGLKSELLFTSDTQSLTRWMKNAIYNFCKKEINTREFRFIYTANLKEGEILNDKEKKLIYKIQNHSEFVVDEDYSWTDEFNTTRREEIEFINNKIKKGEKYYENSDESDEDENYKIIKKKKIEKKQEEEEEEKEEEVEEEKEEEEEEQEVENKEIKEKEKFICEVCLKGFNNKSNLNRHLKNHKEKIKFKCSECNKDFSTKYNLDRHKKVTHK